MDSYLLLKFIHILGVSAFMGGSLSSLLGHRQLEQTRAPQTEIRSLIRQVDLWGITGGAWLLFLAGMAAALIAGRGIYHSTWVMWGFGFFVAQASLAYAAVRTNRRFLKGQEKNWQREKRCQFYLGVNLLIGVASIFLMVTKPSS
jgi:hypothetical protein